MSMVNEITKIIKRFQADKNLSSYLDDSGSIPILSTVSDAFKANASDKEEDMLSKLEVNIYDAIIDDSGMLDNNSLARLTKAGYIVSKCDSSYAPYSYMLTVQTPIKFGILF